LQTQIRYSKRQTNYLCPMINNFKIDFEGAEFEFLTMNAIKLQLFQVYVQHEGKRTRFHMQVNDEGVFYITDKNSCPEIYHPLEKTLSDAILKLGETVSVKFELAKGLGVEAKELLDF
jgi:hypothetical protein